MGFLNVVEKLYSVFAEPTNHQMFVDMQTALGLKQKEIVQPSDTCRARKWRSVFAIKTHYTAIMRRLRDLSEQGEKGSVEPNGLFHHMTRVSFNPSLIIFHDVLKVIHVAHKGLQSINTTVANTA